MWTITADQGLTVDSYTPPVRMLDVEIGPANFVTVEKWDWTVDDPQNRTGKEKTKLRISYRNHRIAWEGSEIPVVLREKEAVLFLIGYDRETQLAKVNGKSRYTYFRQDDNRMTRIRPDEFPKELATQNMWLSDKNEFDAVLRLDTTNPWFQCSPNAFIWEHLLTGTVKDVSVQKELLDEFVQKYKPIKLTVIERKAAEK